jgi:hypothetical protein
MIPAEVAIGTAIAAVSLVGWLAAFGLVLVATRPVRPDAAPATQELGPAPEAPAVVSLLVNDWKLNEDAAESTLLDLAGRRILELRQPDDDPRNTTVHLPQARPSGLAPYEALMYERVVSVAKGGVVPLRALKFRDPRAAARFQSRIRSAVVAEARNLGLSRRRISAQVMVVLAGLALLSGAGVAVAVLVGTWGAEGRDLRPVGGAGAITFVALNSVLARGYGERDTPLGREVAARWLGVRRWLVDTEAFGDLPPAAVAVWDRYLAYGAAVGASRVASEVIDLSLTNRRKIWSAYGGTWRVVRVRYPRVWPRYGQTVPTLVFRGAAALVVAYVLSRAIGFVDEVGPIPRVDLIQAAMAAVAAGLGFYGLYAVARALTDLVTTRRITGEVLWKQRESSDTDHPSNWFLAVDDGATDRTTAWILPADQSGACSVHDVVEVAVRPWSRRVASVAVTTAGAAERGWGSADDGAVAGLGDRAGVLAGVGLGVGASRVADGAAALTGEEVSAALGTTVSQARRASAGRGLTLDSYTDGNGDVALVSLVGSGTMASMALAAHRRSGNQVGGVGDEAWVGDDWAMARRGSTVVSLRLQGPAKTRTEHLPWLLSQALGRVGA